MRLINILIISLLFSNLFSFSQSWCYLGAEWNYGYYSPYPVSNGYIKLNYTKDTIINTFTYNKIEETFYGYNAAYGTNSVTISQGNYFLRANGNVVSIYNGQYPEDTLYNFNAAIGDKWLRVKHPGGPTCNAIRRAVTVLDTGSNIINGVKLKRLVLSYVRGLAVSSPTTTYIDTVFERMGSVKFHLVPWGCETNTPTPGLSGNYPIGDFRCYSDNTFTNYHHSGTPSCYYINSINDYGGISNKISVYPNPSANYFRVDNLTYDRFIIYNVLGQEMMQGLAKEKTDINDLSPGLYSLKLYSSNRLVYTTKIIKE